MNIFIDRIDSHQLVSRNDLQRLFWKLSLRLHPDKNREERAHEQFIQLKSDYEEALRYFDSVTLLKKVFPDPEDAFDRLRLLDTFCDLVASNYPVDKRIIHENKMYAARVNDFKRQFNIKYKVLVDYDEFEEELYRIRGGEVILNDDFALVKDMFYQLCSYHCSRYAYLEKGIQRRYRAISQLFEKKGYEKVLNFIRIMVDEVQGKK